MSTNPAAGGSGGARGGAATLQEAGQWSRGRRPHVFLADGADPPAGLGWRSEPWAEEEEEGVYGWG